MLNETEKKQDQIIRACIDNVLPVALYNRQQSKNGYFQAFVNAEISGFSREIEFLEVENLDAAEFHDLKQYQIPLPTLTDEQKERGYLLHEITVFIQFIWTHNHKEINLQFTRAILEPPKDTETHTTPPVDYGTLNRFVMNVQKFNVMQFNARANVLIQTFGEDKGIEFSERLDKYGLWYFIHAFNAEQRNRFFDLVLSLTI